MVYGRARVRDAQNRWLELDHVHAIDLAHRTEPAGGAARPETDDQRAMRRGVKNRRHEPGHHLRSSIAASAAIRFAIHDERVVARVYERDAALAAVDVPHQ